MRLVGHVVIPGIAANDIKQIEGPGYREQELYRMVASHDGKTTANVYVALIKDESLIRGE